MGYWSLSGKQTRVRLGLVVRQSNAMLSETPSCLLQKEKVSTGLVKMLRITMTGD